MGGHRGKSRQEGKVLNGGAKDTSADPELILHERVLWRR
jgi:hypothetical protein